MNESPNLTGALRSQQIDMRQIQHFISGESPVFQFFIGNEINREVLFVERTVTPQNGLLIFHSDTLHSFMVKPLQILVNSIGVGIKNRN